MKQSSSYRLALTLPCLFWIFGSGCSLKNYDYLKKGDSAVGGSSQAEGGGGTSAGGTGGSDSGGGGASSEGGTTAGEGGTTATTVLPPPHGPWEFDSSSSTADWPINNANPAMTASWVADGEAEPKGSMQLDATALAEVTRLFPSTDLTRYRANYSVRTVAGTVGVKPFSFSGNFAWADGGETLISTSWVIIGITFASPSYVGVDADGVDYSSTAVIAVGLQVNASEAVTLLVDRVWLEAI